MTYLHNRPARKDMRPGRDVCYWVVQRYLDEEHTDLIAQEIYRTAAAVVQMNPDLFKNNRAFTAFVDRVMKRGMSILKPERQHLKKIRVLKRVFSEPVRETCSQFITRKVRKPYTRKPTPPPSKETERVFLATQT